MPVLVVYNQNLICKCIVLHIIEVETACLVLITGSSSHFVHVLTACFYVQLYGCNVLNLGNSRIISVNADTGRQIVKDPHFHGDVQVIDYSPITSMYGAVHCSSQVVRRLPSSLKDKLVTEALKRTRLSDN